MPIVDLGTALRQQIMLAAAITPDDSRQQSRNEQLTGSYRPSIARPIEYLTCADSQKGIVRVRCGRYFDSHRSTRIGLRMRLQSLAFSGYRSFAARSPKAPDRPLEQLRLAPLTLLIGKNNSGKSTVGRLLHHTLLALGADGRDPFPMSDPGRRTHGNSFRDIQHENNFFNPLDLEIQMAGDGLERATLKANLVLLGDADAEVPTLQRVEFKGMGWNAPVVTKGLLPEVESANYWRVGAR
jgi:hypothetical protein